MQWKIQTRDIPKQKNRVHKRSSNVKGIHKWLETKEGNSKQGKQNRLKTIKKNHTWAKRNWLNDLLILFSLLPCFCSGCPAWRKSPLCDTPPQEKKKTLACLLGIPSAYFLYLPWPVSLSAFPSHLAVKKTCPSRPMAALFSAATLQLILGFWRREKKKIKAKEKGIK